MDDFLQQEKIRSRITLLVYGAILLAILGTAVYTARHVIFRPWTAREWGAAEGVGQKIFVFGGRTKDNTFYDDVYQIDLKANTLKRVATMPAPCFAMESILHNESIYLIGGYAGTHYTDKNNQNFIHYSHTVFSLFI